MSGIDVFFSYTVVWDSEHQYVAANRVHLFPLVRLGYDLS